jgi:hypothetical protein
VACVQALRASGQARRLGLREAFLLAFLVEPAARFVEPAPLPLGVVLLRSVFVELTPPTSVGRQPRRVSLRRRRRPEARRSAYRWRALRGVAGAGATGDANTDDVKRKA